MKYVDVIFPLPLSSVFTYSVSPELETSVCVGCRVVVPFGPKKIYTGLVVGVRDDYSGNYKLKSVMEILDRAPVLLPLQMELWRWIAEYYLCTLGDVYKAALPSGMKLESESLVTLNKDFCGCLKMSGRQQAVLDALSDKGEMTLSQLQNACGDKKAVTVVKTLLDKGVLKMKEEVRRSYKPRTEVRVRLTKEYFDEAKLNGALDGMGRAYKRKALLMKYLELSEAGAALHLDNPHMLVEVGRRQLVEAAGGTMQVCNDLVEAGILETYLYETGRLARTDVVDTVGLAPLSEAQSEALSRIEEEFHARPVCLLHGVTSSGKTEIYIHLIQKMLEQGKQVLYLVPEIALTTQLTERLYRVFGPKMGVYHSKFSDAERVEIWRKQLSDEPYELMLGVRSSLFLPFQRLGLVVVDEEHEQSYKQQEPAPRYHARNAAIVLAQKCGAKTLLGSATPSLETYHNVQVGKYGFVALTERFGRVQLPEVEVVDVKELRRKRRMSGFFSPRLLEEMRAALGRKEQVILFQNRRGYAPVVECHTCGWVPKCLHCDVSLTYHKEQEKLVCHYCGYTCNVPQHCPACEGTDLVQRGFGTERVEDEVQQVFPDASVARMDLDTTRSRTAYERMLADFQAGKTDILIGTQMVTKGLDFERVSVVGILDADGMLNVPDFRSHERAFQLMAQVAGRAGRRHKRGLVVLQTKSPDLPVVRQVVAHDYAGLYVQQMEERQAFGFPPFCRLVYIYIKYRDPHYLDQIAARMASQLRAVLGPRVLGPAAPPVSRIQTFYIRRIVVKLEPGISLARVREELLRVRQDVFSSCEGSSSAQVYFDVDPV